MRMQSDVERLIREHVHRAGEDPADLVQFRPIAGGWDNAVAFEVTRRDGTRRTINLRELAPEKEAGWNVEKGIHAAVAGLMLSGVALAFLGARGWGAIVFGLPFVLAVVMFAGHLFNWVILGIHGPGWIHPVDYLKRSIAARTMLIGAVCAVLIWWHSQ